MHVLTKPRFSELPFEGETLKVKHLTSREFSEFQRLQESDALKAAEYVLKVSIEGVTDEVLLDIPMSTRTELFRSIIKINSADKESTESAIKN